MEKVIKNFREECFLNNTDPIVVGVSGGADSLCLLDLLLKLGFQPILAHFNHGIRAESSDEAIYMDQIGSEKGIKVIHGAASVPKHARTESLSIEESARILRYKFLFEQAIRLDVQAVAVAHNQDDQVETILMHLLRGTGLNGLTGMSFHELPNPWNQEIPLVRPLLNINREEIDTYCLQNKLKTVLDRSNFNTQYLRNFLRHKIIPGLEERTPGFRDRIWRTGELLKEDQQVLKELTEEVWNSLYLEVGEDFVCIKLGSFRNQTVGLQRRLIRRGIKEITKSLKDIDYDIVDRIRIYAYSSIYGHEMDIGQGIKVLIEEDRLYIARWESKLPTYFWPQIQNEFMTPVPGEVQLGDKWKLEINWAEDVERVMTTAIKNQNPNIAWLDTKDQRNFLLIRGRKPGDRFQPLGMGGRSMKISDYMINQKIPWRARQHWPLVLISENIAWVVGKQLGDSFRITKKSRWVLKLALSSLK